MEALRQRRAGEVDPADEPEEAEVAEPLEEQVNRFWEFPGSLEGFSVSIRPPAIEMPLLKRLGDAAFVPAPGLTVQLRAAFNAISEKAVEVAYRETELDR